MSVGRILVGAVVAVAGYFTGNPYLIATGIGIAFGSEIIGLLVDIPKPPTGLDQQSGSQVYNLQNAQNAARLQQAKPVLYGRFKVFPDLIAQPWRQYVNNEEIVHLLLAVTQGRCTLEQLYIGDAEISSFSEIETRLYEPGEVIRLFESNVATNEQVRDLALDLDAAAQAGRRPLRYGGSFIQRKPPDGGVEIIAESRRAQPAFQGFSVGVQITVEGTQNNNGTYTVAEILDDGNRIRIEQDAGGLPVFVAEDADSTVREIIVPMPIGPFASGPIGAQVEEVGIDVEFPRGLAFVDDGGNLQLTTVDVRVRLRIEGEAADAVDEIISLTAASLTPQRFTRKFDVPRAPGGDTRRVMATLELLTPRSESTRLINEAVWTGLRGVIRGLQEPVQVPGQGTIYNDGSSLFPDLTVLAVKMRVTGQINGVSARRINGIFQRILPVWDGTQWVEQASSSIAWAFADVVRNTDYGLAKADTALSLPDLLAFDAAASARGDFFNGYFDRGVTAWEALKSIARCGRATPITDGRVFWLLRDEARALRAALFTDRNIVKDSLGMQFSPRRPETATGVRVAYHDPVSFQVKTVEVGPQANATDITLFGCASRDQAWREGSFILNETQYRRLSVSFKTEADGFIPSFGDLLTVQSFWADFGQASEVLSVSADGLTLTLADAFDWSQAAPYAVQLRDAEGVPTDALPCSRGAADHIVVLDAPCPIAIADGSSSVRTHIALSSGDRQPIDVLVRGITADDEYHASITCVLDDPRVHADPGPAPAEAS